MCPSTCKVAFIFQSDEGAEVDCFAEKLKTKNSSTPKKKKIDGKVTENVSRK